MPGGPDLNAWKNLEASNQRQLTNTVRLFAGAVVGALAISALVVGGRQTAGSLALLGTSTPSPTATQTSTLVPTYTSTPSPTPTVTSTPTPTASPTATSTATEEEGPPTITAVATSGTPLPTNTPTPSPTPVPRTVLVETLELPDVTDAVDHFRFSRPFSDEFATWGSTYYPFGTDGRGQYLWHHGVDIQNELGTPVLAVGDGVVVQAGEDNQTPVGPTPDFYGRYVLIKHDREWNGQSVFTLYGHVSKVLVEPGQHVTAGQPIAEVGQEGIALGPHLHLEVRLGEPNYRNTINPDLWIKPDADFGVVAGRVIDAKGYVVPQQPVFLYRVQAPDKVWRQNFTYPDGEFRSDPEWGELFTFGDVPAGDYLLKTYFDGRLFSQPIAVIAGKTTFVILDAGKLPVATPIATVQETIPSPSPEPPPLEEAVTPSPAEETPAAEPQP